ncbi:DJ-1/PfpI family protein [Mucilaginibacter sp.]|uniref:DJ-1/PfpI family protein n=1 Tax=Mucilaginibacter sp. TaxID=1882438 RepID=UPI0035BC48F1
MKNFKNITTSILVILMSILSFGCKQTEEKTAAKTVIQDGKIKVAILVYQNAELLDFAGPSEVFSNSKDFQVYTVSAISGKVTTNNNTLSISPDFTISDAPQPDILVIPGGPMKAVGLMANNKEVMDWVNKINGKTQVTMSVCTGAAILSKTGLLDGKTATTHSGAIDTLQSLTPKAKFISNVRFVEDGKIITTAGVSAGIDGALHVVEKLKGYKEALFVTAVLEYDKWNPKGGKVIGSENKDKPAMDMNMSASKDGITKSDLPSKTISADQKDMVCGMTIPKGSSRYHFAYKGKDYRFCSSVCRDLFIKNSALYAGKN